MVAYPEGAVVRFTAFTFAPVEGEDLEFCLHRNLSPLPLNTPPLILFKLLSSLPIHTLRRVLTIR